MSNETIRFLPLLESHYKQVSQIYQQGIETRNATFESKSPSWSDWDKGHLKACRIVAELGETIVGWAALSATSSRSVYRGVAEVSVYISQDHFGKKIGTLLLEKLIQESENEGVWTLQSGIFPENKASIIIHERLGFRVVGIRNKIGKMDGVWRDTILMERRSGVVGVR